MNFVKIYAFVFAGFFCFMTHSMSKKPGIGKMARRRMTQSTPVTPQSSPNMPVLGNFRSIVAPQSSQSLPAVLCYTEDQLRALKPGSIPKLDPWVLRRLILMGVGKQQ